MGSAKSKKVLVIASGDKLREAQEAGADLVGGEDWSTKSNPRVGPISTPSLPPRI
jgi:ribosomal protein L1